MLYFYRPIIFSECHAALGMEDGNITDGQISASSEKSASQKAIQGRLHFQNAPSLAGGWTAGSNNLNQWFQIDLDSEYAKVTMVATQGRDAGGGTKQWVTMYKLQYGNNGVHFRYYRQQGQTASKVKLKQI